MANQEPSTTCQLLCTPTENQVPGSSYSPYKACALRALFVATSLRQLGWLESCLWLCLLCYVKEVSMGQEKLQVTTRFSANIMRLVLKTRYILPDTKNTSSLQS